MNNQLFNTKVSSHSRDYFFDVKQSQRGDYYLSISQSKKIDDGYERQNLMVFNNLLPDFAAAFVQSMQKLSELDPAIVWDPRNVEISNASIVSESELTSSETTKPKRYRELSAAELEHEQMENIRNGKPKNSGLRWSDEDRQRIKKFFLRGETVNAIASTLERSAYSITAELKKQGLIVDEKPTINSKPF